MPASSSSWSRPEEAMQTVSEQVSQEIHQSLKNMGLAALSSDSTASLIRQLQNIAKKEDCVRSVIGEHAYWGGGNVLGRGTSHPWESVTEPFNNEKQDHWASHCSGFSFFSKCWVENIFLSVQREILVLRKVCTQEFKTSE